MSYIVGDACNDCGMCLRACPRGAIRLTLSEAIPVMITSLDCNDCAKCVIVCPTGAITADPDWAVCWGRGCPLSSKRFDGWTCTEGRRRCPGCGNSLWKEPGTREWSCIRCDHGRKVICPKVRKAEVIGADLPAARSGGRNVGLGPTNLPPVREVASHG